MYIKGMETKIDDYTRFTSLTTRICDYNYIIAMPPIKDSQIFNKYVAIKGIDSLLKAKIICLLNGKNYVILQNY